MGALPNRGGADTNCRGALLSGGADGVDDAEALSPMGCHPPARTTLYGVASQPRGDAADLLPGPLAGLPALGYRFALVIGCATHLQ